MRYKRLPNDTNSLNPFEVNEPNSHDEIRDSFGIALRMYHELNKNTEWRDLLFSDFEARDILCLQKSDSTKGQDNSSFKFEVIAPNVYRFLREINYIPVDKYIDSLSSHPLISRVNSGASGSFFFQSYEEEYLIKSVKKAEAQFLRSFLPHYTQKISDHSVSLLPRFYGFYNYNKFPKKTRVIVMNNIFPRSLEIEQTFDLKGSKYKRKSTKCTDTTLKDLNFRESYKKGFFLTRETYNCIIKAISNDVKFLKSLNVIDYSLLIGIHRVDKGLNYCTTSSVFAPKNGFVAYTAEMEKVYLFMGIIDTLQSYGIRKKVEKFLKSFLVDPIHLSVNTPIYYAKRFEYFIKDIFHVLPEGYEKLVIQNVVESTTPYDNFTPLVPPSDRVETHKFRYEIFQDVKNFDTRSATGAFIRMTNMDNIHGKTENVAYKPSSNDSGVKITTFDRVFITVSPS